MRTSDEDDGGEKDGIAGREWLKQVSGRDGEIEQEGEDRRRYVERTQRE